MWPLPAWAGAIWSLMDREEAHDWRGPLSEWGLQAILSEDRTAGLQDTDPQAWDQGALRPAPHLSEEWETQRDQEQPGWPSMANSVTLTGWGPAPHGAVVCGRCGLSQRHGVWVELAQLLE